MDTEIACYGLRVPAVHAQLHDGCPPLGGIFHLVVERVVPLYLQGYRFLLEHPLYGADIRLSAEAGPYYVGDLVEVER
jgi:hypothetical protein